jgi:hypothetical protein
MRFTLIVIQIAIWIYMILYRIIQDSSWNQNLSINFGSKNSRKSAMYFIDNTLSYIKRVCFGNDHQIIYSHKNRIQKHMQRLLSLVNYKNIPLIIKYRLDLNNFCTTIYFMLYNLLLTVNNCIKVRSWLASVQVSRRSQGTLLPSSGEPKVSNLWNKCVTQELI